MCDHERYAPGCDDCHRDGDEVGAWEDMRAEIARLRSEVERLTREREDVERACDMPLGMIATTLEAHRNTAQADHEARQQAEAERDAALRERDEARAWESSHWIVEVDALRSRLEATQDAARWFLPAIEDTFKNLSPAHGAAEVREFGTRLAILRGVLSASDPKEGAR